MGTRSLLFLLLLSIVGRIRGLELGLARVVRKILAFVSKQAKENPTPPGDRAPTKNKFWNRPDMAV